VAKRPRRGFEEAQAPFAPAVDLAAIYAAYGYRCAFTGADLTAEARADPVGWLLRLDPAGGLVAGNLVPASTDAIWAYEQGHFAIGTRNEFLVALDVISPEFLERLNPTGRLTLPADPAFAPGTAVLKAHRDEFADGWL
jgi:hypothetical protein